MATSLIEINITRYIEKIGVRNQIFLEAERVFISYVNRACVARGLYSTAAVKKTRLKTRLGGWLGPLNTNLASKNHSKVRTESSSNITLGSPNHSKVRTESIASGFLKRKNTVGLEQNRLRARAWSAKPLRASSRIDRGRALKSQNHCGPRAESISTVLWEGVYTLHLQ